MDAGELEFSPMEYKSMGGRIAGSAWVIIVFKMILQILKADTPSSRNEYTKEDDLHLMEYIARRIPCKSMGGRLGNKIYKELLERVREAT